MSPAEYQKDIQSKVAVGQHRKTYHTNVKRKNLTDSSELFQGEISSKLSKLGNIMRVETLILNFSIKDGLKIVSKTKIRNCWSMIRDLHLCTSYTVYLESLKTLYKKTIYIYLYIYIYILKQTCLEKLQIKMVQGFFTLISFLNSMKKQWQWVQ